MAFTAVTVMVFCLLAVPCHGFTTPGPYETMNLPPTGVTRGLDSIDRQSGPRENNNGSNPDYFPNGQNYNVGDSGIPPDRRPLGTNERRNQQGNSMDPRPRSGGRNGFEVVRNYGRLMPRGPGGNPVDPRARPQNQNGFELGPNFGRPMPQSTGDNRVDPRPRPQNQNGFELGPNFGRPMPQSPGDNPVDPRPRPQNQNGLELVPNYGRPIPDSNPVPGPPSRGVPDFRRTGGQDMRPRSGTRQPDGYPVGNQPDAYPKRNERPFYGPYDRNQPNYGYRNEQHRYAVNSRGVEYGQRVPDGTYGPGPRSVGDVRSGQYQPNYPWPPAQPQRSTYEYRYSPQYTSQVVAFSVTSRSSQTFYTDGDVIFNNIVTNVGRGYDYRYGVFTAPVDGIYIVTYHAASQPRTNKPAILNLLRNGRVVNSARGQGVAGMASNSAILFLARYDRLSVQGRAGTAIFCETGQAFCSFNVGLLSAGSFPQSTYPY